ncbi:hypothetical protein BD289DRAFT_362949 [Coniella lustricola]|uniref:Uncharacterized protein n=1 Tax=Coniella lustricola TaxID=2025994 RepID=A0A2T3AFX8_9PEZI|nr:hypothetical protein BD289DRAFT_362949 [Coniella lustricola]
MSSPGSIGWSGPSQNVPAPENHLFYQLWAQGDVRDGLFASLTKSDLCALRLANSACCNVVTRRLFQRIHLTFTANSFTRPYRVEALARIGHHIDSLTFYLPHSEATFLPPLIHPSTGAEISYLYTPHTSMASTLTRPKYGNSELGDILTQQYPPLFHASTNVPSFIHAIKNLPNLRHLTIKTPGQNPTERYRRDIVDYALMSLRIAVERTPNLKKLIKLTLNGVHPAAFLYLKFQDGPGFGCSPIAGKRWRQIRKMHIGVEAWDFHGPGGPGLDQLKLIDDYLRQFQGSLEKLSFTWLGGKGPCPLALSQDPLFDTPKENKKLFNEVTSPMSPLPARPGVRGSIRFSKLKYLQLRNASMHSAQLRGLVEGHRDSVKEFDFENVVLLNGGNWDEALQPLMAPQTPSSSSHPASRYSVADRDEVEIRHQSAAVEAVGKELLDQDLEGLEESLGVRPRPSLSRASSSLEESLPSYHRATQWPRPRASSHPIPPPPSYPAPPPPSYAAPPPPFTPAKSTQSLSSQSVHSIPEEQEPLESDEVAPLNISAPIISAEALPVLLQPMVYSPLASTASIPLNYLNKGNGHNVNEGLSAVQRNLEQEEIQRRYAEDADARTSALKKAREAVLEKLGRLQGKDGKVEEEELLDMHPALQDDDYYSTKPRPRGGSGNSGRLRELFGAVKNGGGGEKGHGAGLYMNVEESNTVLVPLVYSPTRS